MFLKSQLSLITTYRIDLYGRWLLNLFAVMLYVALWSVTSGDVADTYKLVAYFSLYYGVLNNIHSSKVAVWIGQAINSGELNNFLIKPVYFPLLQIIRGLAAVLVRIMVPVLIIGLGSVFLPQAFAPLSPINFLAFVFFTILGFLIWNMMIVSVGMIAFLGTEITATLTTLDLVINLAKGAYIPAFFFPLVVTRGLSYTFIPYLASYPIKLYQEPIVWSEFGFGLTIALVWLVIFSLMAVYSYKVGLKRYEAAGG